VTASKLPRIPLSFNGATLIPIVVDTHGTPIPLDVMLDTGFATGSGYGLKLNTMHEQATYYTITGTVRLANGLLVPTDYILDGTVVEIDRHPTQITLPTMFMDGGNLAGCMFLQHCRLELDGPGCQGSLEF
jgi:hypothetical protein